MAARWARRASGSPVWLLARPFWAARRRLRLIAVAAASSCNCSLRAAASRPPEPVVLELCDRALGVRLTIDGGVAPGRRAHPLWRGDCGGVLGAGLRRDQRRRLDLLKLGVAVLAGIAGIGAELGDGVPGKAGAADQGAERVGLAAGRRLGLHGHDHPRFRVNGDLAAMHQQAARQARTSPRTWGRPTFIAVQSSTARSSRRTAASSSDRRTASSTQRRLVVGRHRPPRARAPPVAPGLGPAARTAEDAVLL